MKKTDNPVRKRKIIRKFITTFLGTVGIFLLAFVVVVAGLSMFGSGNEAVNHLTEGLGEKTSINNIFSSKEERTFFLIAGTDDDGTRTDVMILGCFNPETTGIDLISLPRDTKVTMPKDRIDILKEKGKVVPSDGIMKLTEVHHYAGKELGMDYLKAQIYDLLGVKPEFYVKIDLDAFEYLVDEIGGVEFDVPQRMYYHDPIQNLHIDLYPGVQTLDGKSAEGLVRYRSYPQGDIKRMEVQQAFIKAFVKKALTKENLLNNAASAVSAALKYVETDFNMTKLPGYLKYVTGFKTENISTYTLPMTGTVYINSKSYVVLDEPKSKELVQSLFYDSDPVEEEPATEKRIQVLNGGNSAGLAKKGKEVLEENGFAVEAVGDYSGTREDNPRIFVNSRSLGKDIQKILPESVVIFDPNLDKNYDIIVVIGKKGV